jgi:diguanylate cyclase (GGDEF)-like protein
VKSRRFGVGSLVNGLAPRLGALTLLASLAVSAALTWIALGTLRGHAADLGPEGVASLSRWAWTMNGVIVLATAGISYALAAWRLKPLLDLAEAARRLASGEAEVRVPETDTVGEVRVLARSFNHMASRLDYTHHELERRHRELARANEVLEQLSATDGLTQLYNHRHFQAQFLREAKRAERSGTPLCLVLVDVDDFKLLNDRLGHSAGDRVLQEIAKAMRGQIRETDYLARYGGEEFVLLLPETGPDGVLSQAERLRRAVEELPLPGAETQPLGRLTISLGVACYPDNGRDAESLVRAADEALYRAKGAGRNRVAA